MHGHICTNSPEKIRFGVKFEISSIDVQVKLGCSGVGNTDGDGQVLWILAQVKRRRYHDDDGGDDGQTYNKREAGELLAASAPELEPERRPIRPQRATLWMNSFNPAVLSCQTTAVHVFFTDSPTVSTAHLNQKHLYCCTQLQVALI